MYLLVLGAVLYMISWNYIAEHAIFWQARREKISERMKILQDLVPGCNKVVHILIYRRIVLLL